MKALLIEAAYVAATIAVFAAMGIMLAWRG